MNAKLIARFATATAIAAMIALDGQAAHAATHATTAAQSTTTAASVSPNNNPWE